MPWPCGRGILLWITVPSAATTSWTSASSVRRTKHQPPRRNVQWLGASAIMHSTSTASHAGLKPGRSVPSTIVSGNSRSMDIKLHFPKDALPS